MRKLKIFIFVLFLCITVCPMATYAGTQYEDTEIEDVPGQLTFIGDVLAVWDDNIKNVADVIVTSPWEWSRGVKIVEVMDKIYTLMLPIAQQLAVIFFFMGCFHKFSSFVEMKRPEVLFTMFFRFAFTIYLVKDSKTIMKWIWDIVAWIISKCNIMLQNTSNVIIPKSIITCVDDLNFLESAVAWILALLCSGAILVCLGFLLITVFARFFKFYMYTAISPAAMSPSASASLQQHALAFAKSFISILLEGVLIVLSCVIFSYFAASTEPLMVGLTYVGLGGFALWIAERIVSCFVLLAIVKGSDHLAQRMFGT